MDVSDGGSVLVVDDDPAVGKVAMARLREMQNFTNTLDGWFTQMMAVPPATLMGLIKLGSRIVKLASLGRK